MSFVFTEDYFKEETRHGFTITSTMKRCWACQLRVVGAIDDICKRYNLKYFAYWGTLLGAVRSHGMIPWDDDIDIAMTRDCFNGLVEHIDELPDTLHLIGKDASNFPFTGFYRITNTDHIRWTDDYLKNNYDFPMMAGVDIFVFDYIPREREIYNSICQILQVTLDAADLIVKNPKDPSLPQKIVNIQNFIGHRLDPSSDKSIVYQLQELYEIAAQSTFPEEADDLGMYNHMMYHDPGQHFPKEAFEHMIRVPFETGTIVIPENYELFLTHRFGNDYIIPEKIKGAHNYPYYRSELKMIDDYCKEHNTDEPIVKCNLQEEMDRYIYN